jgi:cell division transport system ATP-binding protein
MIRFHGVSKQYNSSEFALRDVDLEIGQGEFVFLTGPNGAGKTTLLKLMNVMERPTAGEVLIEGRSSSEMSRREVARLRRRVGMIFQEMRLLRDRDVEENVRIALEVSGVPRSAHGSKIVKVLTHLGLLSKRNARPTELSWGEQQKVAIARAIVNEPVLLLADEPTEKLDRDSALEILDILRDVNLWGTTVVLASHNPSLPVKGAGRVVRLEAGRIENDTVLEVPTPGNVRT